MSKIVHDFNWSATPLGPQDSWPVTLGSALSICLNTPIVSAVLWGPELITIYNDAYVLALADRHPWALGKPHSQIWADVWDVLGPQVELVIETGNGFSTHHQLLKMHRHGRIEDTYWLYSFAPLLGDDRTVSGIFVTALETTDRVRLEHQGAADMERLRQMFDQAPGFM
ncbi:MAG: histidine kinase, partial [Alphaproteobacteria bacterium]